MSTAEVSNADICCLWTRSEYDFDGGVNPDPLTMAEVALLLKKNQIGINTCIVVQFMISVLWGMASIVPGFALYDGAPGTTSAYTHLGWWREIELVVLIVGALCTYFGLSYASKSGTIEKGIHQTRNWITFYFVILMFGIVSNLAHAILTSFEIASCTSTLCTNYYWCICMLLSMVLFLAVLEFWTGLQARKYQKHLRWALSFDKIDYTLGGGGGGGGGSVPTPATTQSRIRTPLLQGLKQK